MIEDNICLPVPRWGVASACYLYKFDRTELCSMAYLIPYNGLGHIMSLRNDFSDLKPMVVVMKICDKIFSGEFRM